VEGFVAVKETDRFATFGLKKDVEYDASMPAGAENDDVHRVMLPAVTSR
jgi:hypothetical protein